MQISMQLWKTTYKIRACGKKPRTGWILLSTTWKPLPQCCQQVGTYLLYFSAHLALEKILKAHVTEFTQSIPPRSHDLISLTKKSGVELPETYLDFVGKLNTASIPTRYPEDLQNALKDYPKSVAQDYLQHTKELIEWLRQHPRLKQ